MNLISNTNYKVKLVNAQVISNDSLMIFESHVNAMPLGIQWELAPPTKEKTKTRFSVSILEVDSLTINSFKNDFDQGLPVFEEKSDLRLNLLIHNLKVFQRIKADNHFYFTDLWRDKVSETYFLIVLHQNVIFIKSLDKDLNFTGRLNYIINNNLKIINR